MEVKEVADRIVVAKPVASRPSCSSFGSFTELLAGAIDECPIASSEAPIPAIRPKTMRFKPLVNPIPPQFTSSKGEDLEITACSPDEMKSHGTPAVVYRPLAKLAPRTVGTFLMAQEKQVQFDIEKQSTEILIPNIYRYNLSAPESGNTEPFNMVTQNVDIEQRSLPLSTSGDQSAYDGYNWRKYGQKQVKGSEYPRSYYKCTHPSCPVKKKVERSLDGMIAEIVYKGEHNHSKPHTLKSSSTVQLEDPVRDAINRDISMTCKANFSNINETPEARAHSNSIAGFGSSTIPTADNCDDEEKLEGNGNKPCDKRRKTEAESNEAGQSTEAVEDPKIIVQCSTESEVRGDGFRWRKYGQKVVRGNPYPRSYYRCTALKCNVRKYVERVSDDPQAFITTYEGKHSHDMPAKGPASAGSASDHPAISKKNNA